MVIRMEGLHGGESDVVVREGRTASGLVWSGLGWPEQLVLTGMWSVTVIRTGNVLYWLLLYCIVHVLTRPIVRWLLPLSDHVWICHHCVFFFCLVLLLMHYKRESSVRRQKHVQTHTYIYIYTQTKREKKKRKFQTKYSNGFLQHTHTHIQFRLLENLSNIIHTFPSHHNFFPPRNISSSAPLSSLLLRKIHPISFLRLPT